MELPHSLFQINDGHDWSAETGSLSIDFASVNDPTVISGEDTGTITESSNDNGNLVATGVLSIVDEDVDEAVFIEENISGQYGDLFISKAGNWTYTADNSQNAIQQLGDNDSLIETLVVTSADGTKKIH